MIDGANVDDIGRRNLMLELSIEPAHPNVNRLLKGKLVILKGSSISFGAAVDDVQITH